MNLPLRKSWSVADSLLLGSLVALCAWVHRQALGDIAAIGLGREEQSHIILVPLVAFWLFWIRRSRLRSLQVSRSLAGPAIILLGVGLEALGVALDIQALWHLAPLVSFLGAVVSLTGLQVVRKFAPVFIALLFMVPVPGTVRHLIGLPLQAVATMITEMTLVVLSVDATRLGNVILINGQQVAVGEACNGMRMVFALGLVVYAFAFSFPLRPGVRVVLLLLSPVAALLSNIIRLIPTTLIYGFGGQSQAEAFHDLSGWAMLPVAIVMLVGVLRAIRWIELPVMSFRLTMR